jgi:ubiquinone/menaquinone biosynthesis C-methylase UbiE
MFLNPFRSRREDFSLAVGMTGVKMGDRLVQVSCGDAGRLAVIAGKVGLSGRAVAVVGDPGTGAQIEKAASRAGVLVDVIVSPPTRLPLENGEFDLAIIDDTGAAFTGMNADDRGALVRETVRVLRPGGRVMVIGTTPATGVAAALSRSTTPPSIDPTSALQADGYKTVRLLAERQGLIFYEGLKPRV